MVTLWIAMSSRSSCLQQIHPGRSLWTTSNGQANNHEPTPTVMYATFTDIVASTNPLMP